MMINDMTADFLELKDRMERAGRFWQQLQNYGFKRSFMCSPITERQIECGGDLYTIQHESLPDVCFAFQLNKKATHVTETTLPKYLFDEPVGFVTAYKHMPINDYLLFINKAVRHKCEQITEKLFNTTV